MTLTINQLILANAPAIPGLRFRLFAGESDLQANVDLNNACYKADMEEYVDTMEQARHWLAHLDDKHNPYTDMIVAEIDGVPGMVAKGMVSWMSNDEGEWLTMVHGWVHPEWRHKGIGRAMQGWLEQRGRALLIGRAPAGATCIFQTWSGDHVASKIGLLKANGYTATRFTGMMVRPLDEPIPDLALPAGLEVRPSTKADLRTLFEAFNEAFRDHWGHREWTESDFQGWYDDPELDTALYQVAWDIASNQVAGGVLTYVSPKQNAALGQKRGWTDPIAVRRPWRKQGVAKALIARSLRDLKAHGMTEAALGVDTQNPNGAYKLYESMGFRMYRSGTVWRKDM